mmetsp:Transcript_5229/g.7878  ORF Transcript_5229/g.7878 Transcript_5229/m.7878 type:complete len:90 (+) Transcript_5229:3-272(+)
MQPTSAGDVPLESWELLAVVVLATIVCIGCCCMCRSGGRRRERRQIADIHSDDFVFDAKPYSDKSLRDEYGEDDSDDESDGEVELPTMA